MNNKRDRRVGIVMTSAAFELFADVPKGDGSQLDALRSELKDVIRRTNKKLKALYSPEEWSMEPNKIEIWLK